VRTQRHPEDSVYRKHSRALGRSAWLMKELSEIKYESR